MNLDLRGKHALVCGASQGIGRAAAIALAELGADVTVLARSRAALEAVVAALPRSGAQAHAWIDVDMNDAAALRARVEAAATARPITILVNNTGGPGRRARARRRCSRLPGSIPAAPARQPRPGAGRAARHAERALGPRGQRDLDLGQGADPRPGRVQHHPRRGRGLGQDPGRRTRPRRHHRQQRAARLHHHPAPRADPAGSRPRQRQGAGRGRGRHARQRPGRPLRGGSARSPPRSRSWPRRRPATSTASTCRWTAAARSRCETRRPGPACTPTPRAAKLSA